MNNLFNMSMILFILIVVIGLVIHILSLKSEKYSYRLYLVFTCLQGTAFFILLITAYYTYMSDKENENRAKLNLIDDIWVKYKKEVLSYYPESVELYEQISESKMNIPVGNIDKKRQVLVNNYLAALFYQNLFQYFQEKSNLGDASAIEKKFYYYLRSPIIRNFYYENKQFFSKKLYTFIEDVFSKYYYNYS